MQKQLRDILRETEWIIALLGWIWKQLKAWGLPIIVWIIGYLKALDPLIAFVLFLVVAVAMFGFWNLLDWCKGREKQEPGEPQGKSDDLAVEPSLQLGKAALAGVHEPGQRFDPFGEQMGERDCEDPFSLDGERQFKVRLDSRSDLDRAEKIARRLHLKKLPNVKGESDITLQLFGSYNLLGRAWMKFRDEGIKVKPICADLCIDLVANLDAATLRARRDVINRTVAELESSQNFVSSAKENANTKDAKKELTNVWEYMQKARERWKKEQDDLIAD